jgi:hypothetical protein
VVHVSPESWQLTIAGGRVDDLPCDGGGGGGPRCADVRVGR